MIFIRFRELVDNKLIDFDYKLKKGKLKNTNAIRILEVNNYPASVIKDAMATAKELRLTGGIQENGNSSPEIKHLAKK